MIKRTLSKREKGVALLLVIVIIAIMLPIVTDMNYEARTEFMIAMNYKEKAETLVLAQSGITFAVTVFDLQKQLESMMKALGGKSSSTGSFELWDIIPFDTALLRSFTQAGPFLDIEDMTDKEALEKQGEDNAGTDGGETGDAIFDFPGDFKLDFTNEDQKINLNSINFGGIKTVTKMLESVIAPEEYDFIFEENTNRHEFVDRVELVQNIVDWIDKDSDRYSDNEKYAGGGAEQSLYDDFTPQYQVKNAGLDSIPELRMIYGVNDVIYRLIAPNVTIYSTGKINISKAPSSMLESLIRAYAKDPSLGIFYDRRQMREFMGKILMRKTRDGWSKPKDFIKSVQEEGVQLNRAISKIITTKGRIYRIRSVGSKNGVESWIEIVVDKKGNKYYYRQG
ncbi:general secretion pathway protein GspK [bacterium]|nr:general secretion pathway protein GspK [bacterium]